ncbi:MAG: acetyl-CoA acyltransferase [Clostridium sp.]
MAIAANSIMAEQADVILAGGVESMSSVPMGGGRISPNPYLIDNNPDSCASMGITAENVAVKYGVTRVEQDQFGLESQLKASKAQAEGKFYDEIIPVQAVRKITDKNGIISTENSIFSKDEGIRPGSNIEKLTKLKSVFKMNGTVTPGNSSQLSDGAAMVLIMSREKAESLGVKPIAIFRSFAVAGVPSELMGIGPIEAIPKALKIAGLTKDDIDLIELNEAFASQSITCIKELGLDKEKVNVNGGAIALGHPLGCTGAFLTIKLISELKRRNGKYGLVSMCIGGGMGAAAVFEIV